MMKKNIDKNKIQIKEDSQKNKINESVNLKYYKSDVALNVYFKNI